ncbi:glucarate dehydratase family protein [Sphingomonas sp. SUN039]|uniref:glucarate dehydratase family protein n=1 Tax=Sphingomonas sp. SUN039 TaxID=2937787 RepID=UPI002164C419|nr:glucarate dehydratase family protein [Sphingomonas sp. SUN039]UVO55677.1 glucarate dehydratase family protein [Sphingomonas sp. SUN039]
MPSITRVRVTPIAFRDPPLLNAAGIHEPYALRSIIEVETGEGLVGLGESYGDAPALTAFEAVAQLLPGLDIFDLNGLVRLVEQAVAGLPQAAPGAELAPGSHPAKLIANSVSALEVALLDLQAQHARVPLHALLGGAVRREVPFSAYLFFKYARHVETEETPDDWGEAVTPAQIVEQAQRMIAAHGFGSIKLKAGTLPPATEVASIVALAKAFPGLPLRIDPNGAWSMETALACAEELGPLIEYYEDPVDGLDAMAELHRRTGLPLATNMVVTDFDQLRRSVSIDAVQIVLSDHHYWGGLRASQHLAAMCRTFGLGLSMHSNSHLGISLMAMSHLAAATPDLTYACDTHYPWVEDADEVVTGGKIAFSNGCIAVGDSPGLGVTLDRDRLARAHATFNRIAIRSRDDGGQMRKYDPAFSAAKPRY